MLRSLRVLASLLLLDILKTLLEDVGGEPAALPGCDIVVENEVDFLEGAARGFRVGEEDVDGHDEAEDAEDDVRLPDDVGEGGCDEVRNGKVEDPVSCR